MRWLDFKRLYRFFTTGNFRPDNVAMPGMLAPAPPPTPSSIRTKTTASTLVLSPGAMRPQPQKKQAAEQIPQPVPQLQVQSNLQLCKAIDTVASRRVYTPVTDDGRQF